MVSVSRAIISLQKSLRPFSSSSSPLKLFGDHSNDVIEDSPAYVRALLSRPPTLPRNLPGNSCSFIGHVVRPVKKYAGNNPKLGVYTFLEVKSPPRASDPDSSSSSFRLLLVLRENLSEISQRYLKQHDYIYVHGPLQSYEKMNASGKPEIFYKVSVTEWNFVRQNDKNQKINKPESAHHELIMPSSWAAATASNHEELSSDILSDEERQRNRLRLWQEFFANPHEWWDNRGRKKYPRESDFKHRVMKERLWLNPDDPPWIRKQLDMYDSKMERQRCNRSDSLEWKDFV